MMRDRLESEHVFFLDLRASLIRSISVVFAAAPTQRPLVFCAVRLWTCTPYSVSVQVETAARKLSSEQKVVPFECSLEIRQWLFTQAAVTNATSIVARRIRADVKGLLFFFFFGKFIASIAWSLSCARIRRRFVLPFTNRDTYLVTLMLPVWWTVFFYVTIYALTITFW